MFDHTAVIAAETDRFAAAIRSADQQAPVPTCPDWTVADLAWHLTEVHAFWPGFWARGRSPTTIRRRSRTPNRLVRATCRPPWRC